MGSRFFVCLFFPGVISNLFVFNEIADPKRRHRILKKEAVVFALKATRIQRETETEDKL